MVAVGELRDIVNWKQGLISPAVLFDDELYQQEQSAYSGVPGSWWPTKTWSANRATT